jgi:hypothetical protein
VVEVGGWEAWSARLSTFSRESLKSSICSRLQQRVASDTSSVNLIQVIMDNNGQYLTLILA